MVLFANLIKWNYYASFYCPFEWSHQLAFPGVDMKTQVAKGYRGGNKTAFYNHSKEKLGIQLHQKNSKTAFPKPTMAIVRAKGKRILEY